jgi:4-hydroxythreonine-4-phosphate dehydrogenase
MLLGVTLGDACGVGPEILVRTAAQGRIEHPYVVYGDRSALQLACESAEVLLELNVVDSPAQARPGACNLVALDRLDPADITPGVLSEQCGSAALAYLDRAVDDALAGEIDAIVTLPMNKEATRLRHPEFTGHTERIARACGTDRYAMMLASDDLAVTHVSTHLSMGQAVQAVRTERILEVIRLTHEALQDLMEHPRIAVAGLNPHAGEHGSFGSEEVEQIEPAIQAARDAGIVCEGPIPPDTVFMRAFEGRWDAVVCMYHDQGHIPMKLMGFGETVNVTIGLPVIRCSVDHGTAFDIAYQGVADPDNFLAACRYAARLVQGRA